MKITADSIRQGFGHVKSFLNHSYSQANKFANTLDSHVSVARRAYGVVAPLLDEFTGTRANNTAMKALDTYDNLKRKVVDGDSRGREVHARLRKAAPELIISLFINGRTNISKNND